MKNQKLLRITVLTVLLLGAAQMNAKVWRVNNAPGCSSWTNINFRVFNTLTQAVEQAAATDTLYIEGSAIPYEAVTLTKPLTLIGTGYFLDENLNLQHNLQTSKVYSVTLGAGSSGSTLMGLEMFGATAFGANAIYLGNNPLNDITITRCRAAYIAFQNVAGTTHNNINIFKNYIVEFGIRAEAFGGNGPITNIIIRNNYITQLALNNDFSGAISQNMILLDVFVYGIPFFNNIVMGNQIPENATNSISNIHHNIFGFSAPAYLNGGTNYFSLSDAYVFLDLNDTQDKKYKLKTQASNLCPECYLGFPANVQVGMYGGVDPYIPSGIPAIPTIYALQSESAVMQGSTIGVTISSRSNN